VVYNHGIEGVGGNHVGSLEGWMASTASGAASCSELGCRHSTGAALASPAWGSGRLRE